MRHRDGSEPRAVWTGEGRVSFRWLDSKTKVQHIRWKRERTHTLRARRARIDSRRSHKGLSGSPSSSARSSCTRASDSIPFNKKA